MPVLSKIKQHKLVLDTHVWIWAMLNEKKISSSFKKTFETVYDSGHIYISAISPWEVGMLVEKKKLSLEMDCLDWVEQSMEGFHLAPISPRIAVQSTRIPGLNHLDPADRLLVATARELNAVLVTHDEKLIQFGKEKFISVFDPC